MNVVLSCWVNSAKCLKCRRLSGLSCAAERCGSGGSGGGGGGGGSDPAVRVAAHERLGEVLRILRIILERYPALQSTELLVAAGSLIHQVKGKQLDVQIFEFFSFFLIHSIRPLCVCPTPETEHPYDDERNDVKEFMESIDQLALAFSSR